jgi:hypothetical protein
MKRTIHSVVAALVLMAGMSTVAENKNTLRGAVYLPAKAYNAPQMWAEYSSEITRRDLGYAKQINVNALRVWVSYDLWLKSPAEFKTKLDDFLSIADSYGILVMPSLFDNCGVEDEDIKWSKDITVAMCSRVPPASVFEDESKWGKPREYIKWFMENYRNDNRILSIEVYNEPRAKSTMRLAENLFALANSMKGTTPLSIGTNNLEEVEHFIKLGCTDMVHVHCNFPKDEKEIVDKIEDALAMAKKYNIKHVCLGEWQRIRPAGSGWGNDPIPMDERYTDLSSLAPVVQRYEMSTFFWCLMVKPAYLTPQRVKGTINGLFFEDGSVYSLEDARNIAGDPNLDLKETKAFPAWMVYPVKDAKTAAPKKAKKNKKKAPVDGAQYD